MVNVPHIGLMFRSQYIVSMRYSCAGESGMENTIITIRIIEDNTAKAVSLVHCGVTLMWYFPTATIVGVIVKV